MKRIFAERLQETRKDKGITQEQLSIKLNIPKSTISSWERGLAEPNSQTQILIAKVLDTTVGYLIGETDTNTPNILDNEILNNGQHFFRFDTKDLNEKEIVELNEQLEDMASILINSIVKRRKK